MSGTADRPLLLLDHDGVVVNSLDVFAGALVEACRRVGLPAVDSPDAVLALFEGNMYESLAALGAGDDQIREVLRRVAGALRVAMPALRPFPLMPEVLAELAQARTVAIVTSNAVDVVERFLRRHGIHGVAEVCGVEAGRGKVAKIRRLMAGFAGQEVCWFVGDTAGDMREARLAGARPLGVAWGWHDPTLLEEAGAEVIAGTPAELLAIVAPELVPGFLGTGPPRSR